MELIRAPDISLGVFSLAAQILCQRNDAGKKTKQLFEDLIQLCSDNKQTNRHNDNICARFWWNSFFRDVCCLFLMKYLFQCEEQEFEGDF